VTILSLPAEILAQVFEETWKTRGASGLTPYLTVCRKWKVRGVAFFLTFGP
jgi:hypothetical protein